MTNTASPIGNTTDPRELAFALLTSLAAQEAGPKLFGENLELAQEALRKSLIGAAYPSFWFEAPFAGAAGFDLHVYYDRGQIGAEDHFAEGCGFGMQPLFDWYFGRETGGVGVGFAHDLRGGEIVTGAYVNFNKRPLHDLRRFFEALDAADAHAYTQAFLEREPAGWSPWYIGLFPGRADAGMRVGSFVGRKRQAAYARDVHEIAADFTQVGFSAFDNELLCRVQALAALPYQLELQFDATETGVGDVLGVDLTLAMRGPAQARKAFTVGAAAQACELLERWGVADRRWEHVAPSSFARLIPSCSDEDASPLLLSCSPAFIKAKWADAQPQAAKVYLLCSARPIDLAELAHNE